MHIIETVEEPERLMSKHRYWIDCPLDVELHDPEVRRIEVPRELALYIQRLQFENARLSAENKQYRKIQGHE